MKKRILVIDHEHLMLYGLKKALSQDQVEVDTATTASEAKQALRSCRYDLCLIDIRLPDENGFKMMEVVRELCPGIQIILMTSSDIILDDELQENIQKAKADGVCHFLCKPFDLNELKDVIAKLLRADATVDKEWFEKSFAVISRRRSERKKWFKKIDFFISVISDGEVQRRVFTAESLDLGKDGLGLLSPHPLKKNEVISFGEDMGHKSGVVVWSSLLDDQRCRAGIRFA